MQHTKLKHTQLLLYPLGTNQLILQPRYATKTLITQTDTHKTTTHYTNTPHHNTHIHRYTFIYQWYILKPKQLAHTTNIHQKTRPATSTTASLCSQNTHNTKYTQHKIYTQNLHTKSTHKFYHTNSTTQILHTNSTHKFYTHTRISRQKQNVNEIWTPQHSDNSWIQQQSVMQ